MSFFNKKEIVAIQKDLEKLESRLDEVPDTESTERYTDNAIGDLESRLEERIEDLERNADTDHENRIDDLEEQVSELRKLVKSLLPKEKEEEVPNDIAR
jgi:uncharacterized protein YceH (UPF0502 family)